LHDLSQALRGLEAVFGGKVYRQRRLGDGWDSIVP
jgi:hypothetical protein